MRWRQNSEEDFRYEEASDKKSCARETDSRLHPAISPSMDIVSVPIQSHVAGGDSVKCVSKVLMTGIEFELQAGMTSTKRSDVTVLEIITDDKETMKLDKGDSGRECRGAEVRAKERETTAKAEKVVLHHVMNGIHETEREGRRRCTAARQLATHDTWASEAGKDQFN